MSAEMIILVLLIATALAFDFTNGFHDTGNAMATSIATGALKPKTAVLLAGVLNLVGAFLSVEVAITVTTSVLKIQDGKTGSLLSGIDPSTGLTIIFYGLIGGILWNLLTWLFGIPSSSSHALFGGLIGAGLAATVADTYTVATGSDAWETDKSVSLNLTDMGTSLSVIAKATQETRSFLPTLSAQQKVLGDLSVTTALTDTGSSLAKSITAGFSHRW